jgi:hypothetical protein
MGARSLLPAPRIFDRSHPSITDGRVQPACRARPARHMNRRGEGNLRRETSARGLRRTGRSHPHARRYCHPLHSSRSHRVHTLRNRRHNAWPQNDRTRSLRGRSIRPSPNHVFPQQTLGRQRLQAPGSLLPKGRSLRGESSSCTSFRSRPNELLAQTSGEN